MVLIALIASLALNAYLIFHETMNKIQYIGWLRIYWITRDVGDPETEPVFERAFMRQTMAPYWRGKGLKVRLKNYTFQFGILTGKGRDLLDQLDGRHLDDDVEDIKQWN